MEDPLDQLVQFMLARDLDETVDRVLSHVENYDLRRVTLYQWCIDHHLSASDGLNPAWLPLGA